MRRWAYEIHSTFTAPGSVRILPVNQDLMQVEDFDWFIITLSCFSLATLSSSCGREYRERNWWRSGTGVWQRRNVEKGTFFGLQQLLVILLTWPNPMCLCVLPISPLDSCFLWPYHAFPELWSFAACRMLFPKMSVESLKNSLLINWFRCEVPLDASLPMNFPIYTWFLWLPSNDSYRF